ncbi:MAG TPA: M1 family peptidase, partial [Chitinophagaceae bacterium]
MKKVIPFLMLFTGFCAALEAQIQNNSISNHGNKFEQLGSILPTPNEYRSASGAPGPKYWQQRCDYDIKCELDEKNLKLTGSEMITYFNNSPDQLTYLWLQLDENEHSSSNNANYQDGSTMPDRVPTSLVDRMEASSQPNDFGDKIKSISDAAGKALNYTINKTMMRVELP